MSAFNLDDDEVIILRDENVTDNTGSKVSLVLTNKKLIKSFAGTWTRSKEAYSFPLTQLRESNGNPNVLIGKDSEGKSRLELYFTNSQQFFRFKALLAEKKWAAAITKAYKAQIKEIAKSENEPIGAAKFFAPVLGKIDAAKEAIAQREQKTITTKCPFCGASVQGPKGTETQCRYCKSVFTIK